MQVGEVAEAEAGVHRRAGGDDAAFAGAAVERLILPEPLLGDAEGVEQFLGVLTVVTATAVAQGQRQLGGALEPRRGVVGLRVVVARARRASPAASSAMVVRALS